MEISILLLTYNHVEFVRQALDSVVRQKINVSYEVIILDDASTDETPRILKEYKKKYPEMISLYLRKVNSSWPTKNGYFMLSRAKGKYCAWLEGDDYWTDNFKVQKQYDFLENHAEYSACVTDVAIVDEKNNEIDGDFCAGTYAKKEDHIYTIEDLRHFRLPGRMTSLFIRNRFNKEEYRILYKADRMMGDVTLHMLCLRNGNIYQMGESMAAYRYVHRAGEENFSSIQIGNIYRNYMQTRYWIQLENYMQQYDSRFEFASMTNVIRQTANQYSAKAVITLLLTAQHRKKYLLLYFIHRFLLDSVYTLEGEGCRAGRRCSWKKFIHERMQIIIFGAGAVAEEYIDKYAWKGNILFLVDNNPRKQNTSMKGFLIRKPEEILKYKDRANILIASKDYLGEIGKQLNEMGIENYYCYCSMQARRMRNKIANMLIECLNV